MTPVIDCRASDWQDSFLDQVAATGAAVIQVIRPEPSVSTDGLLHLVTDDDDNVSLCGLDVSGHEWANTGDRCVVCAELDEVLP